jgi:hypothetical protein
MSTLWGEYTVDSKLKVHLYNSYKPCMANKKLSVYLPEPLFEALNQWAETEKRPTGNLAAYILEVVIREHLNKNFSVSNIPKGTNDND